MKKKLTKIIEEAAKHIRIWDNRGFTEKELEDMAGEAQKRQACRVLVDFGEESAGNHKVIPFPGEKKIYPNDPCPCGSGKKYKYCCGRKKK